MSQVTRTFCDICGEEFKSSYWDEAPVHVVLTMTPPAQMYDSRDCKEVCRRCRDRIHDAFKAPARCAESKP